MSSPFRAFSFLLAALALPALAQQPAAPLAPAAPTSAGPAFVLKTAAAEVAQMIAGSFDVMEELPALAAGGHYVLTLGADKKLLVTTGTGDVGFLQATADPAILFEVFAEEIESVKSIVQGAVTMVLQQEGIAPEQSAGFLKGFWAFPQQLQRVTLQVTGDPEDPKAKGLDLAFAFDAKAGGYFADFVGAMKPCKAGAPQLAGADGAAIAMAASLAPESLRALFEPMLGWVASMTHQDAAARQQAEAFYRKFLGLHDGSFAFVFAPDLSGRYAMGLTDGEGMRQMMSSPEYAEMMKGQKFAGNKVEVEVVPEAFEHRGVKVMKSTTTSDVPNPMMKDGVLVSYHGIVGTWAAGTLGGTEQQAKAMIDAAADGKIARAPLAGGGLVHLRCDLRAFVEMLQQQQPGFEGEASDDMPDAVTVTLGARPGSLTLHVHVQ
ncbi:MAG: hypothetical protein FJ265_16575 [Planctomycetes bacterium]|nr:hypothetical protein [Planctomycetota bacterium]